MLLLPGTDHEVCALHDFGGDGPPVLLTHGNGLNAGMWATVIPTLRQHRQCFGLDFRGHGASRIVAPPLDVDRARLVEEVLNAVAAIDGGPIERWATPWAERRYCAPNSRTLAPFEGSGCLSR